MSFASSEKSVVVALSSPTSKYPTVTPRKEAMSETYFAGISRPSFSRLFNVEVETPISTPGEFYFFPVTRNISAIRAFIAIALTIIYCSVLSIQHFGKSLYRDYVILSWRHSKPQAAQFVRLARSSIAILPLIYYVVNLVTKAVLS